MNEPDYIEVWKIVPPRSRITNKNTDKNTTDKTTKSDQRRKYCQLQCQLRHYRYHRCIQEYYRSRDIQRCKRRRRRRQYYYDDSQDDYEDYQTTTQKYPVILSSKTQDFINKCRDESQYSYYPDFTLYDNVPYNDGVLYNNIAYNNTLSNFVRCNSTPDNSTLYNPVLKVLINNIIYALTSEYKVQTIV